MGIAIVSVWNKEKAVVDLRVKNRPKLNLLLGALTKGGTSPKFKIKKLVIMLCIMGLLHEGGLIRHAHAQ